MSNGSEFGLDLNRILSDTFVQHAQYYETIDSTNDVALELCHRDDLQMPILVVAGEQTAGRGRGSNQWWSSPGALTFSLVIRPSDWGLTQQLWPKASLTTGLAICCALADLLPEDEISLKWPNDVHLRRRKISGVLVEVGPSRSGMLVVGIGLNVNNSFRTAPDALQATATSLIDATGQCFDLTEVLVYVLRQLQVQFSRLARDDQQLASDWQQRCALSGLNVEVRAGTSTTSGVCQGIDDEGALVVLTEGGPTRVFGGVVTRIW